MKTNSKGLYGSITHHGKTTTFKSKEVFRAYRRHLLDAGEAIIYSVFGINRLNIRCNEKK